LNFDEKKKKKKEEGQSFFLRIFSKVFEFFLRLKEMDSRGEDEKKLGKRQ